MTNTPPLEVQTWGSGEPVVLIHGCVVDGPSTWSAQRPLAESGQWELNVVQRRGFGSSQPSNRDDFYIDASDVARVVARPVHLVGHSWGGLVALLMAAEHPDLVRSLVMIEPPAYSVASADPTISAAVARFDCWWNDSPDDEGEFLRGWAEHFGIRIRVPDSLPAEMRSAVALLRGCRRPWTARLPTNALASAPFPKLVVSGGHSETLDVICDALAERTHAERATVRGAGHLVPHVGEVFNNVLVEFFTSDLRLSP